MVNIAGFFPGLNIDTYVELNMLANQNAELSSVQSEMVLASNLRSERERDRPHFQAQYRCHYPHEFPEDIAVGYAAGAKSSCPEAMEEALYLSAVLGGVLVSGVYRNEHGCNGGHFEAVKRTLAVWKAFFSKQSGGIFIQYYNHDAGKYVSEAYQTTPYQSSIILVGVNAYVTVDSPTSYLFRTRWDIETSLRKRLEQDYGVCRETLLPINPSASGIFSLRFIDPTFVESIQSVFQTVVKHHVESDVPSYAISPAIAALLSVPLPFGKTVTVARAFNTDLFSRVELLTACSEVFHLEDAIWPRERTARVAGLFLALMRTVDYGTALVDACVSSCSGEPLLRAVIACSTVFWSVLSVGLAFLLFDRTFFKRSVSHTIVLIWSGFSPAVNAVEFAFFTYQYLQQPQRYVVIFSQCACSFAYTVLCSSRRVRQLGYWVARGFIGDLQKQVNVSRSILSESEEDPKLGGTCVDNHFQQKIESQRVFLHFFYVAISGGLFLTRYISSSSPLGASAANRSSCGITKAYVGGDIFRAVCSTIALFMLVIFFLIRRFGRK